MLREDEKKCQDQLVDVLLREVFANNRRSGDLSDKIIRRLHCRRWWARPAGILAASVVAAVALIFLMTGSGSDGVKYPSPKLSGSYWVTAGSPQQRGMEVSTAESSALLELGGYVHVTLEPHSSISVEGADHRESIRLVRGRLRCNVAGGDDRFGVTSEGVSFDTSGAMFSAGMIGPEGRDDSSELLLTVHSGSVIVSGSQGPVRIDPGKPVLLTAGSMTSTKVPQVEIVPQMTLRQASAAWAKLILNWPEMLRPIQRSEIAQEGLYVVSVISSSQETVGSGDRTFRVRVAKTIVGIDGPMQNEFTLHVYNPIGRKLAIPQSSKHLYLARIVRASHDVDEESRYYLRPVCGYSSLGQGRNSMIAFPWTAGDIVETFSTLLSYDGNKVEAKSVLDKVLSGIKSNNRVVGIFAAQFAAVQGWRFIPHVTGGSDRFARAILASPDKSVSHMLSTAYTSSITNKTDILPRSIRLMHELLHHPDFAIASPALKSLATMGTDSNRQKIAAGVVADILDGDEKLDMRRASLLEGLVTWKAGIYALKEQLEAMSLSLPPHPWPPAQRQKAAELLKLLYDDQITMIED